MARRHSLSRPALSRLALSRLALAAAAVTPIEISTAFADEAETVFWKSIMASKDGAEFCAYIETYPNGKFSSLARLRAKKYGGECAGPARKSAGGGKTDTPKKKAAVAIPTDWISTSYSMGIFEGRTWTGTDKDCTVDLRFTDYVKDRTFTWTRTCGNRIEKDTKPYALSPGATWLNLPKEALFANLCVLYTNSRGDAQLRGCPYRGTYRNEAAAPKLIEFHRKAVEAAELKKKLVLTRMNKTLFAKKERGAKVYAAPEKGARELFDRELKHGDKVTVTAKAELNGKTFYRISLDGGGEGYVESWILDDRRPLTIRGSQWFAKGKKCEATLNFSNDLGDEKKFEWEVNCGGKIRSYCGNLEIRGTSALIIPKVDENYTNACGVKMSNDGQTLTFNRECRVRGRYRRTGPYKRLILCDNPMR